MDIQKEVSAVTGTQKWDKTPRPETAATKQEGIHQDLQENYWTGDRETNCHIYCWVADNQGLDLVEGSIPSEIEEPPCSFSIRGARKVGTLTTWDSFGPTVGKEKLLDDGEAPVLTGTLSGSRSDERL
jgi:hypothetical protein